MRKRVLLTLKGRTEGKKKYNQQFAGDYYRTRPGIKGTLDKDVYVE
jgi:hypothetical protein